MSLSEQAGIAAEHFREHGYAVIRRFLEGEELLALQAESRRIYAEGLKHHATYRHGHLAFEILPETDFDQRYVIQAYWMAWISPYFETLRRHPNYLAVLEPLLGRSVKQVAQQIHWKPPGAGLTGYRFHQDLRFRASQADYRDIVGSTVTTGLAIDPSTLSNGCLRVVPGGHKRGYLGLSDEGSGQIMLGHTQEDELRAVGLDPETVVDLELEPGDLALWGLLTPHGSLPNTSDRDRAFALSSYVKAENSERGEWAFRDGESVPLGPEPKLCKYEKLFEEPGPLYDETAWWRQDP
ncbi:MAG: phytanoyl-CoA dioxygenase family protein [Alphaproteobacteria bacterium]|nr:phytanoyl-CoA dioxygenase family protein [Alphaproteobacteria bacterium]